MKAYKKVPDILVYEQMTKVQQLDATEQLLDKFEEYKATDTDCMFYALLTMNYDRIVYDGKLGKITVLCY